MHRNGRCAAEVAARTASAESWYTFRHDFVSRATHASRKMSFIALILSSLVLGLDSKVLKREEEANLESYLASRLRAMAKGAVHSERTDEQGNTLHKSITNLEVFKLSRISPSQLELLAQRLRWYATVGKGRVIMKSYYPQIS